MRTLRLLLSPLLLAVVAACSSAPAPATPPPGETPPASSAKASAPHPRETFATSQGELVATAVKHATVMFEFAGKVIYIDPWSEGDFTGMPKADFVFITDIHPDHLDSKAIDGIKKAETVLVGPPAVGEKIKLGVTIANGESKQVGPVGVEAVPMYNLERGPAPGKFFHDKGRGDGFILTFGDKRVYLSGDTECTPEMKALKNIDVAFVCMNLPYTMPPSEAATCIKAFRPKVIIPYHYRGQNIDDLAAALKGESGIELRRVNFY